MLIKRKKANGMLNIGLNQRYNFDEDLGTDRTYDRSRGRVSFTVSITKYCTY